MTGVLITLGVTDGVIVDVVDGVSVTVGVMVGVAVNVGVRVGVRVGVGVGGAQPFTITGRYAIARAISPSLGSGFSVKLPTCALKENCAPGRAPAFGFSVRV